MGRQNQQQLLKLVYTIYTQLVSREFNAGKKRQGGVYSLLMMRSVFFERETKYTVAGKLMTTAPPNFLPPTPSFFFPPPPFTLLPQDSASVPASSPVCCRRQQLVLRPFTSNFPPVFGPLFFSSSLSLVFVCLQPLGRSVKVFAKQMEAPCFCSLCN